MYYYYYFGCCPTFGYTLVAGYLVRLVTHLGCWLVTLHGWLHVVGWVGWLVTLRLVGYAVAVGCAPLHLLVVVPLHVFIWLRLVTFVWLLVIWLLRWLVTLWLHTLRWLVTPHTLCLVVGCLGYTHIWLLHCTHARCCYRLRLLLHLVGYLVTFGWLVAFFICWLVVWLHTPFLGYLQLVICWLLLWLRCWLFGSLPLWLLFGCTFTFVRLHVYGCCLYFCCTFWFGYVGLLPHIWFVGSRLVVGLVAHTHPHVGWLVGLRLFGYTFGWVWLVVGCCGWLLLPHTLVTHALLVVGCWLLRFTLFARCLVVCVTRADLVWLRLPLRLFVTHLFGLRLRLLRLVVVTFTFILRWLLVGWLVGFLYTVGWVVWVTRARTLVAHGYAFTRCCG